MHKTTTGLSDFYIISYCSVEIVASQLFKNDLNEHVCFVLYFTEKKYSCGVCSNASCIYGYEKAKNGCDVCNWCAQPCEVSDSCSRSQC